MKKNSTYLLPVAMVLCLFLLIAFLISIQLSDKESNADIKDVTAAVTKVTDMSLMNEGDNNMVKRLYGLDPSQFEGITLYYPGSATVANEIFIVKLKSTDQQLDVKAAIEARLSTQTENFNGYGVGQYEMLQDSIIDVSGNYIMFIVSSNPKEADAAYNESL